MGVVFLSLPSKLKIDWHVRWCGWTVKICAQGKRGYKMCVKNVWFAVRYIKFSIFNPSCPITCHITRPH